MYVLQMESHRFIVMLSFLSFLFSFHDNPFRHFSLDLPEHTPGINVSRSRFLPVKKTSDLLLVCLQEKGEFERVEDSHGV